MAAVPDHPRSRGVYSLCCDGAIGDTGSSPLARGLRRARRKPLPPRRIIPARAGFTRRHPGCPELLRDHPRSRGVYSQENRATTFFYGSSPLARGLLASVSQRFYDLGIIPARAGFTWAISSKNVKRPDHPRSRGVYTCGSLESQRRGTLPDCVCLHCRPSARSAEFR